MKSFTVLISIYNMAIDFIVTRIGSKPYHLSWKVASRACFDEIFYQS